jgi:hypothetical protein
VMYPQLEPVEFRHGPASFPAIHAFLA